MSEGHSPEVLIRMNSVIRGIDLSSKLLSPVFTGLIISFVSLRASAITFAAWATITVWIEYWLFISVYNGVPAIVQSDERRSLRLSQSQAEETDSASSYYVPLLQGTTAEETYRRNTQSRTGILRVLERISESSFVAAWRNYLNQEIVLPGVALALLFFTVLRFFFSLFVSSLCWLLFCIYMYNVLLRQLWNIDDGDIGVERCTYLYHWYRQRSQCGCWTSCYRRVPFHAIPSLTAQNRTLVFLVSGTYLKDLHCHQSA